MEAHPWQPSVAARLLLLCVLMLAAACRLGVAQVKDQEWRSGNQALRRAFEEHLPIRVARGRKE